MSKNLIPVITDCLGVRIGEEFKLKYNGNDYILKNCEKEKIYRFTETELEEQDYYDNNMWHGATFALDNIVYGIYEIVKLPFKPKTGYQYWSYNKAWEVESWVWMNDLLDLVYERIGIVFRTKEEAIAARPAKYRELTGKEWKE